MARLLPETQPREGRPVLPPVTEGSAASRPWTLRFLSLNSGHGCCPLHPIRILHRPKLESRGCAYLTSHVPWSKPPLSRGGKRVSAFSLARAVVEGWVLQCRTPHIWLGQGSSATGHLVSTIFRKIIWVEWKKRVKSKDDEKDESNMMVELQAN